MLDLTIPGFGRLELTDIVCDYNGTLAADGLLLDARARTLAAAAACPYTGRQEMAFLPAA